jgi:transposase
MGWTETTRREHDRRSLRYASDCTDEEWEVIVPFLPPSGKMKRPRKVDLREVWNAIQYLAPAGCARSLLPKDFPLFTTILYFSSLGASWPRRGRAAAAWRALTAATDCH